MYILYGNVAGWKELHRSHEEIDIVYEMGKYIDGYTTVNFLVIDNSKGFDETHKVIKSNNEYIYYFKEVSERYVEAKQYKKRR